MDVARGRVIWLTCVIAGFAGFAAILFALGHLLPALHGDLAYVCLTSTAYPPTSPVPPEGLNPIGRVSLFPLGIQCLYWAGDNVPRVSNYISWMPTLVFLGGLLALCASMFLMHHNRKGNE